METIDLRQAIINRVQDNNKKQLAEVIEESIGNDERTLPGLGVLFEMIWKQSNKTTQTKLIDSLYEHLHQNAGASANPSPS
ncbi:small acid-soluble spore protein SspI [Paenibacillus sp. HB172176]|uniref:small acid-soluble spore protein SspI n=1 Tax=Paenibacillus sp. HB172176 TaxID=2493690 RepID=UPI00143B0C75|nr:small acid-soluble spore protein SspI [Paenibacillus sp. HB172176]